jgi:intracellular septation protein A
MAIDPSLLEAWIRLGGAIIGFVLAIVILILKYRRPENVKGAALIIPSIIAVGGFALAAFGPDNLAQILTTVIVVAFLLFLLGG